MVTQDKILDVSTFGDLISIFKVTAGLQSYLKYKMQSFHMLCPRYFKLGYIVTIDRISDLSTFGDHGSIFKVTAELNV